MKNYFQMLVIHNLLANDIIYICTITIVSAIILINLYVCLWGISERLKKTVGVTGLLPTKL